MDFDTSKVSHLLKGPYYGRRFRKTVLPMLQRTTGVLVESVALRVLREQGFALDPMRDNRSKYEPQALFDKLAKYTSKQSWKVDKRAFELAKSLTFKAFAKPVGDGFLRALSVLEVKSTLKLMNSSGAPEFRKKGEAFTSDVERAAKIMRRVKTPDPCIAYHRTQAGNSGPKVRLVWGYPQSMTIVEGCYAAPLIAKFLRRKSPMAFGMRKMDIASRLIGIQNMKYAYGADFSGFDSSIGTRLIGIAFDVIRTWYEGRYHEDIRLIENYFIFTPIIMPDGNVYVKKRGVPSGSYFTQLVDSIVNYFAIQYIVIRLTGMPVKPAKILVLGDDSIFGSDKFINLHDAASVASELGLVLHPDKTAFSRRGEPLHFLGHVWLKGFQDRPGFETALRMAFPENRSQIADPRVRAQMRIYGYVTDSLQAWPIITRFTRPGFNGVAD